MSDKPDLTVGVRNNQLNREVVVRESRESFGVAEGRRDWAIRRGDKGIVEGKSTDGRVDYFDLFTVWPTGDGSPREKLLPYARGREAARAPAAKSIFRTRNP